MGKIIGLGGVFIKFEDPKAINLWYKEVLGIETNDYGILFGFNHPKATKRGFLQLGTFEKTSTYFGNEKQKVMLNFRVDDLVSFVEIIKEKGVIILDELESYDYGKFIHIQDPEGNRVELWEPVGDDFNTSENFQDMY